MNPIIQTLVEKHNIPVTIENDSSLGLVFNVNTSTKSRLVLKENEDGSFTGHARYNVVHDNLNTVEDIAWAVRDCMHGRDFVAPEWLATMVYYAIVRVETKTTIKTTIV